MIHTSAKLSHHRADSVVSASSRGTHFWKNGTGGNAALNIDAVQCSKLTTVLDEITRNDAHSIPPRLLEYLVEASTRNGWLTPEETCEWMVKQLRARQDGGQLWVVVKVNLILHHLLLRGPLSFARVLRDKGPELLDVLAIMGKIRHTTQLNPRGEPLVPTSDSSDGSLEDPHSPFFTGAGRKRITESLDQLLDCELVSAMGHMSYLESLRDFRLAYPTLSLQNPEMDPTWSMAEYKTLFQSALELLKAVSSTTSRSPLEWSLSISNTQRRCEDVKKWYTLSTRLLFSIFLKLVNTATAGATPSRVSGALPGTGAAATPLPRGSHTGRSSFSTTYSSRCSSSDVNSGGSPFLSPLPDTHLLREWYHLLYQYSRTVQTLQEHLKELSHTSDKSVLRSWGLADYRLEVIPSSHLSRLQASVAEWCRPAILSGTTSNGSSSDCNSPMSPSQANPFLQAMSPITGPGAGGPMALWLRVWADQLDLLVVIFRGDEKLDTLIATARLEQKRLHTLVHKGDIDSPVSGPDSGTDQAANTYGLTETVQTIEENVRTPATIIVTRYSAFAMHVNEMDNPLWDGNESMALTPPDGAPLSPRGCRKSPLSAGRQPDTRSNSLSVHSLSGVSSARSYQYRMMDEAQVESILDNEEAVIICQQSGDGEQMPMMDRFKIVPNSCIGSGNYGRVYRAWDELVGCHLAVKEVLLDEKEGGSAVRDMVKEYTVLTELQHPHIVRVIAFMAMKNRAQIFMEWMPSGSLQEVLAQSLTGRLRENVIRRYTRESLLGLAYLHAKGVLHRDVKPGNMLLSADGSVKLTDFGTSHRLQEKQNTVKTDVIAGTVPYMAPEAVHGIYSPANDVWAVGCTVLHMFTGMIPWQDPHTGTVPEMVALLFLIGNLRDDDATELPHAFLLSDDTRPDTIPAPSPELVDFLNKVFVVNRKQRAQTSQLLQHPFINPRN